MRRGFSEEALNDVDTIRNLMKLVLNMQYGAGGRNTSKQIRARYIDNIMKWALKYGDLRLKRAVRVYRRTKNRRIRDKVWFYILSVARDVIGLSSASPRSTRRAVQKSRRSLSIKAIPITTGRRPYHMSIDLNDIKKTGKYVIEPMPTPPSKPITYEEGWIKRPF